MNGFTFSIEGRAHRETWTRADGLFRIIDRSAGWRSQNLRPWAIQHRTSSGSFWVHTHGVGYYATAEAAAATIRKREPELRHRNGCRPGVTVDIKEY